MTRLLRFTYTRYLFASVGALGVDVTVFLAAMAFASPSLAAGLGYCAGIVAHWLLSTRAVFIGRVAGQGTARAQQFLLFIASAFVGLTVTMGIVGLGDALGVAPLAAKIVAIGVSFQITYLLRHKLVFA